MAGLDFADTLANCLALNPAKLLFAALDKDFRDGPLLQILNVVIDVDKAKQYRIDRAPGIALVGQDGGGAEHDSRIRFLGAPSGYEFISLVQAVLLVGGRPSTLSEETRKRLAMVDKPVTMQVFTTPT